MKDLKDLNWNHLYYFYEVAKAQSLKAGAEVVGLAPSTISEQIKRLEDSFGMKLFQRSSQGLKLSSLGRDLFDRVRGIFEEGSKVLEIFSQHAIGGYPVTVGIEETLSFDLASEFVSQYWDLFIPYGTVNTSRQFDREVLVENLTQGNIDWGISIQKPLKKNLDYERIGSFNIQFYCASELFEKFKETSDLLVNIPLGLINWDTTLNTAILTHLRRKGIIPKETITSDHPDFLRKLCERGRCITFLPDNPMVENQGLTGFNLDQSLVVSLYALWRKKDEGLVSIRMLKELIRSKLSQVPERYKDIDLQIEISEVSEDLLT